MKGKIAEVFKSVQGEGIYFGERQLFVRFFGCNRACKFCDTRLSRFKEYEAQELIAELKRYNGSFHSVSFTGGEPLLQKDFLKEALGLSHRAGYRNYLETNGTLPDEMAEVIDYVDIVAMDIKLPSSTGQEGLWDKHAEFLRIASRKEAVLKIVVCGSTQEEDFNRALKLIKEVNSHAVLVLQPNSFEYGAMLAKKIEEYKEICLKENIAACIIPQMHRLIGVK